MPGALRDKLRRDRAEERYAGALQRWVIGTWLLLGLLWMVFSYLVAFRLDRPTPGFLDHLIQGVVVALLVGFSWIWLEMLRRRLRHPGLTMLLAMLLAVLSTLATGVVLVVALGMAVLQSVLPS